MGFLSSLLQSLTGVRSISYAQYLAASKKKALTLVDVRSPDEFSSGHLPDAINIPLPQIESRLSSIPKDKPVVAVCAHGVRSLKAAKLLASRGFDVSSITGGVSAVPPADLVRGGAGR